MAIHFKTAKIICQFYNYLRSFSSFSLASWSKIRADGEKREKGKISKIEEDISALFFINQLA